MSVDLEALNKDCLLIFKAELVRIGTNLENKPYMSIQGGVSSEDIKKLKEKNIEITGIESNGYQSLVVYVARVV